MGALYSNLVKSCVIPLIDLVMETSVSHFYKTILEMQSYSPDQIRDWQNTSLQKLIYHSYNHTRYYKALFDGVGISPSEIKSIEDLNKIPVLTKDIIRNNYNDLVPNNITEINHKTSSTGGSTGDPLQFLLDLDSWSYIVANHIVYWEKTGYLYGDKHLAIGSSSIFVNEDMSMKHKLYYKLKNKIGVNGMNMSDEVVRTYLNMIRSKNVRFLYGYASGIYLLAKFSLEMNIKLHIIAVFPTSEILTDLYRKTIYEAFDCEIMDEYGAHDGGIIAFETKDNHYEVGYNSLLRIDNIENYIGDVLLTNLQSYSMPFINYSLGDKVEVSKSVLQNTCYNGQVISKVFGRDSNVIFLENGQVLTGPGFTILFKDLSVEAYAIFKTGINTITIEIKKLSSYNQGQEEIIVQTLKKHAGQDSIIKIIYVESFGLTPSGKRKYFFTA